MRIDREISLTMAALRPHYEGNRVAVLMYHGINDRAETRAHPYFKTVTSPSRFAEQMQWLAEANAEVMSLNNWSTPFKEGQSLRVIITFDDGFADFMTDAFPVLREHGYPATMFLPTDFIETGKEHLSGVKHLTWANIRQLNLWGISFGSHTVSHRHLDTLSRHDICKEVSDSAASIRNHLGSPVTSFSCPYAFPQAYPAAVSALRESLEDCGYTVAVTTKIGTVSIHDDPYTLKRLPINEEDDKKLFMAKLHGGYDWLNGIQRMVHSTKKVLHR